MRRTGLGRQGLLDDASGDPLDGLVNLFDLGIVLAVGFLVAALGLTLDRDTHRIERETAPQAKVRAIPSPSQARPATGRGRAVGTVYRLSNGTLVYTQRPKP